MKNALTLFRGDDGLHKTEQALVAVNAQIIELEAKRAGLIAGDDADVEAILRIDGDLSKLDSKVKLLTERIAVLEAGQRKRAQELRAHTKATEVAGKKKLIAARSSVAAEFDRWLEQGQQLFTKLGAADNAIFANWSDVMPHAHKLEYLRVLRSEMFSQQRKQRMSAGVIREMLNRAPYGVADIAEQKGNELIAELEDAAIPEQTGEAA
jgi:hypothetical protein